MKPCLSAVRDDPGRTAMCISLILHGTDKAESRLPAVVHQLRQLEDQAQVVSVTDERGVVTWHIPTPEADTHGPNLGPEIPTGRWFTPTHEQRAHLGL